MDFGSAAGTIVNNNRVDRVDLRDGDCFQIGSVRFGFRIVDAALPDQRVQQPTCEIELSVMKPGRVMLAAVFM
jgi:pSer/pThr/pTyr-binding forkhead associated (FHA) protein